MHEPKDTEKRLGERIRKLRIKQGYSLRELGEMAGVHFSQVQKIEKGNANPKLDTIGRIAEALGTSVVGLLDERDSPRPEIMDVLALLREKPTIQVEKANEILSIVFSGFVQREREPSATRAQGSERGGEQQPTSLGVDMPEGYKSARGDSTIRIPARPRSARTRSSAARATKPGKRK